MLNRNKLMYWSNAVKLHEKSNEKSHEKVERKRYMKGCTKKKLHEIVARNYFTKSCMKKLHEKMHEATWSYMKQCISRHICGQLTRQLKLIDIQNAIIQNCVSWVVTRSGDYASRVALRVSDIMDQKNIKSSVPK